MFYGNTGYGQVAPSLQNCQDVEVSRTKSTDAQKSREAFGQFEIVEMSLYVKVGLLHYLTEPTVWSCGAM